MPKVTEAHLEARRQQILDAAFNCFVRDGFHQTTMQDICREADLSPGAVYRYFSSKEEIIEASCEEGQKQFASIVNAEEDGDTLQVLDELVDVFFGMLAQPGADVEMRLNIQLWGEALRNPRIMETSLRTRTAMMENLKAVIDRGQDRGEINPGLDSQAIAHVLLSAYEGLLLHKAIGPDIDIKQYVDVLKAMYSGLFWQGGKRVTS